MKNCYVCGCELIKENQSLEHIILNSIGGKLKSKKLLCKDCNSRFGGNIDNVLSEQLNIFANLLNIKRETGSPQPIKGIQENTNEQYVMETGGKLEKSKPAVEIIKDNKEIKINIVARSINETRKILNNLKRKYKQINVDDLIKNAESKSEYIGNLMFNTSFGGDKSFRSVCKTAVNYYLSTGGKKEYIEQLIPYINGEIDLNIVNFYYQSSNMRKLERITHSITIKGDKKNKLLYAYVEFFGVCKFIVLLNGNYTGKPVTEKYSYDVIRAKEIKSNIEINLGLDEITDAINGKELSCNKIEESFRSFLEFWSDKVTSERTNEIIANALEEMQNRFPNEEFITKEMTDFLSEKVADEFVKFMYRGIK